MYSFETFSNPHKHIAGNKEGCGVINAEGEKKDTDNYLVSAKFKKHPNCYVEPGV